MCAVRMQRSVGAYGWWVGAAWPGLAGMLLLRCAAVCRGASVLRNETAVDAVELFDRASLRECEVRSLARCVTGTGTCTARHACQACRRLCSSFSRA